MALRFMLCNNPVNIEKLIISLQHDWIGFSRCPDTASRHDSQHFDNVFDTGNTSKEVYADRGYPSKGRAAWLKEHGYGNQIQRKGSSNKPLSACQQRRNHRIAKTRARVEHVFAAIERMRGKTIRTVGQSRANFAMTMMATCYNLKRLVYFQKAGIEVF